MKHSIFYILFILASVSCTKEATIKLPEPESKIVVTCFITPEDSVISAVVRLSTPKFGRKDSSAVTGEDIRDALVQVSDGSSSVTLPFNAQYNFYMVSASSFSIRPGGTYQLYVRTTDGKTVTATTEVPEEKLETEMISLPVKRIDSVSFEQDIRLTIPDIPGKTNYLGLFFYNTVITVPGSNPNIPFFPGLNSWAYFEDDEKLAKTKFYHSSSNGHFGTDTILEAWLDISVLNCSREFYLYNRSVQEAGFAFNPFADPVMVYTNINNGFGCFGSYRAQFHRSRIR